jgi:hypothetical protein
MKAIYMRIIKLPSRGVLVEGACVRISIPSLVKCKVGQLSSGKFRAVNQSWAL